jgi:hypothetical protein
MTCTCQSDSYTLPSCYEGYTSRFICKSCRQLHYGLLLAIIKKGAHRAEEGAVIGTLQYWTYVGRYLVRFVIFEDYMMVFTKTKGEMDYLFSPAFPTLGFSLINEKSTMAQTWALGGKVSNKVIDSVGTFLKA